MAMTRFILPVLLTLLALSFVGIPAAAVTDNGPISPGNLAILQSHLAWNAYTTEVEMNAAITYISPLYGTDTLRLNSLLAEFRSMEAGIPAVSSLQEYRNLTRNMRDLTSQFHDETMTQLILGQTTGNPLSLPISTAKTNNPYIEEKKNAYWNTRKTNQLKDFDAWVLSAQGALDMLKTQGYDTSKAQYTLDTISSKRPEIQSALESKNENQILYMNSAVYPLTQQLGQQVIDAQSQVSERQKMEYLVEEGYRAVFRADTMNNDLVVILLDIGPAEPVLKKTKTDLAATKIMLATGNLPLAKTPLTLVKKDLKDLSSAYRDIGITANLPPDVAANLKSLVIVLDNTADQMEMS
jgi:hypothetical protein